MELIDQLKQNLGVNDEQAKGGAGLIFKMAKDKLGGDFSQVTNAIPDTDDIMKAAPESGGAAGLLKGIASKFGGGGEKIEGVVGLASGFSKLGLDSGMVGKFIPIVLNYAQTKGGDKVKDLIGNVLK